MIQMQHWYALSFIGRHLNGSDQAWGCVYIGYPDQKMTKPRIDAAKAGAELRPDATLLGITYLGYMTKSEFTGLDG